MIASLLLVACGAGEDARPESANVSASTDEAESAEAEPTVAEAEPVPTPPPEPPPPEPIEIEAGAHMGPIRIGMTEAELAALGLESEPVDPRSSRYGPYRVWLRRGAVDRVEARIGELERIRVGDQTYEAGVDIYTLRDAFPRCVWVEGGGERYECADGHLTVQTTHRMDPLYYTLGVH
ncbi:MAG: hypothetical protein AB7S26_07100 [Sandaracinaceae bacterium]